MCRHASAVQLPRTRLLRASMNKAIEKGRGCVPRPHSCGALARLRGTSPYAEAFRHACLAIVGFEAITQAGLVPEDVRLVSEDSVADDGVVRGRRPFDSTNHEHPSGERFGVGWDVIENVVPVNLDVPRSQEADADPRERRRLCGGRAGAGVIVHLVAVHVELARRSRRVGDEYYPYAVVVCVVGSDPSMERVANQDARLTVVGFVTDDIGFRIWRVTCVNCRVLCAADDVRDDLRPGREEGGDPVLSVVEGTVLYELGVPSAEADDPELREVTNREAAYGHVLHILSDLAGIEVHLSEDAKARPLAGALRRLGGRLKYCLDSPQRDPVLLYHHGFVMYATEDHDGIARLGGVDRRLDRLARADDVPLSPVRLRRGASRNDHHQEKCKQTSGDNDAYAPHSCLLPAFLHPIASPSVQGPTSVDCSIEVVPFSEGTSRGAGKMVPIPAPGFPFLSPATSSQGLFTSPRTKQNATAHRVRGSRLRYWLGMSLKRPSVGAGVLASTRNALLPCLPLTNPTLAAAQVRMKDNVL